MSSYGIARTIGNKQCGIISFVWLYLKINISHFKLIWLDHIIVYKAYHVYRKEIPELQYHPVQWSRQPWSASGRYSGFCWPHSRKETQTKCVHHLRALCCVSQVFIFTRRPQYIHTWRITVSLIVGKPWLPHLEPHARIKMAQVLGYLVYICDLTSTYELFVVFFVLFFLFFCFRGSQEALCSTLHQHILSGLKFL